MLKKIEFNAYSFQKWVGIEKILIKLNGQYNEIWEKVSNIIKKEFCSNLVCNEKYLKTKIKSYNEKINTIFTIIKYQKKVLNVFAYQ